jgi:site-specific recombinase XerD
MDAANGFASPLAEEISHFIDRKRVLGRRYETEAGALRLFDRYLVERRVGAIDGITPQVIDEFLSSRPRSRPRSFNHLLGVVRRLFASLVARGTVQRSPVRSPKRRNGSPRTPFIFTPEQARRLLTLAAELPDFPGAGRRGPTFHAVFAIMYALGLRVSEVCRLNAGDVDRRQHVLVIHDTKFGKDRLVPFGPRVGEMLDRYLVLRQAGDRESGSSAPLFALSSGRRLRRHRIGNVFRKLRCKLGLDMPAGAPPPRVHDLRHSFAVRTLLRWYRTGTDPASRLLHLSTFLGHVQPESTAVYLTITAELLAEAGTRFETFASPLVVPVVTETRR